MLANEVIKNDVRGALKAWRKYSKILYVVGVCYWFGILALGLICNASVMIMVAYTMPLAMVAFIYLCIRKTLNDKPDINNASWAVKLYFYMCLMILLGMFFGYLKIAEITALKNVEVITKEVKFNKTPMNITKQAGYPKSLENINSLCRPNAHNIAKVDNVASIKNVPK